MIYSDKTHDTAIYHGENGSVGEKPLRPETLKSGGDLDGSAPEWQPKFLSTLDVGDRVRIIRVGFIPKRGFFVLDFKDENEALEYVKAERAAKKAAEVEFYLRSFTRGDYIVTLEDGEELIAEAIRFFPGTRDAIEAYIVEGELKQLTMAQGRATTVIKI